MIEKINTDTTGTIDSICSAIEDSTPKLVSGIVPGNGADQRLLFLNGQIKNPAHVYDRLGPIDFHGSKSAVEKLAQQLVEHPDLSPKHTRAYEQYADRNLKIIELLRSADAYNNADTPEARNKAKDEYMMLNRELYGVPDEITYRSLLGEKIDDISSKSLTPEADLIRTELFGMVESDRSTHTPERFRPSAATVEWMQEVAYSLYGDMLSHVPEGQDTFSPTEVQAIFEEIIKDEFGESADGWQVVREESGSINVRTSEQRVIIPSKETMRSREGVRKLIVHELGVHLLRAVMGGEMDVRPLRTGLGGYYDFEEGLGVVMEQAIEGRAKSRGVDHYITAGLAYYDDEDFRGAFEVKWRLSLLDKLNENEPVTPEHIESAKNSAYSQTMRCFRGTDSLPLFKDLSYYNGSNDVWRYLEHNIRDDIRFMSVLLGKHDPTNPEHSRVVYEARTV